jgi:PKD repeat protein
MGWKTDLSRRVAVVMSLLRPLGVAVFLGLLLAGGALYSAVRDPRATPSAFACGLGNTPTMMANDAPALLYPVTKNTPADQPIGVFALNYVAGQQIKFVEDLSRVSGAPPANTFKWRWDFGDSTGYDTSIEPKHTFNAAGTFNVHAQIFDASSGAWTDLDSAQIAVIPAPLADAPVAKLTASATAVAIGGSVTFDATGSRAKVGSNVSYLWNFNDGSTATGQHVTHTFAIAGKGIVALIVTDGRGARSVATSDILVVDQLPTAKISADTTSVNAGGTVNFDASQSVAPTTPQNDAIVQYKWSFGDGSPDATTQAPTVGHVFTKAGTYSVTLQAIDQQGAPGIAKMKVTVTGAGVAVAGNGGGPNWGLIGFGTVGLLAAAIGGYFAVQAQRRRNALIRQRMAAMELARARAANSRSPKKGRALPPGTPASRPPRGPGGPSGPSGPNNPSSPYRAGPDSRQAPRNPRS